MVPAPRSPSVSRCRFLSGPRTYSTKQSPRLPPFVERFDANSYLYITWAMNHYDAADRWGGGDLVEACKRLKSKMLVCSFSSDWLYTPEQCRQLAFAMCRAGRAVNYVDVPSNYGHDSFLVEQEPVGKLLESFIGWEDER